MNTGEKIRNYRLSVKWSQAELAKQSGVAKSTIAQYEIGNRSPMFENVVKIATALRISLDELTNSSIQDFEGDRNSFFGRFGGVHFFQEDDKKLIELVAARLKLNY